MVERERAHGTCFEDELMAQARAERSWTLAWVAAASVVHGVLLTWLLVVPVAPHGRAAPERDAITSETEIALVVDTAPAETSNAVASPDVAAVDPPSGASNVATVAAAAVRAATSVIAPSVDVAPAASTGASTGAAEPSPNASANGGGVVVIPLTTAELGIAGAGALNPFLPKREEPEPEPRPAAKGPSRDDGAARALRGLASARDRELGLGPEGPAIAALKGATSSSMAPTKGRASFIIRAGGDGLVFAVDLVDSEGGSGWADAGRLALQSLRGKKVRVPQGARGIAMRIEVRSEMKLPNGESAPFGVREGANRMPEMTIPDVSNIGAKPRRVIHARATGTEVL